MSVDRFVRRLLAALLVLACVASFAPAARAADKIDYDEYVGLIKKVNTLADKFKAFDAAAMSGEARNRFLFERRAEIEALEPVMARLNDPAVEKHEYLTPQVAAVLNGNLDFYRNRSAYALDPKAYDEAPAIGPLKFLYRDSSGRVRAIGSENDLPEGSDAYRKLVRAAGADPDWVAGMAKRRDDAGLAGSTIVMLDERATADTFHFDPSRKAVVVSPRAAERRQADADADLRSVLSHEHAHAMMDDLTGGAGDGTYNLGPDGAHYVNEVTNPNTAFVEGWAEFLDAVPAAPKDGKLSYEYRTASTGRVKYEKATAGDYRELPALFSTYGEMVGCEGIVALYLKTVAALDPGLERRMFDALRASKATCLEEFVKRLAADNPERAPDLADRFDGVTQSKASRATLERIFGAAVVDGMPRFVSVDVRKSPDDPFNRTVTTRKGERSVDLDTDGNWVETLFGGDPGSGTREVLSTRNGKLDLEAWRPLDPETLLRDTEKPAEPPAAKPARKPAPPAATTRVTDVPAKLQKKPIAPGR